MGLATGTHEGVGFKLTKENITLLFAGVTKVSSKYSLPNSDISKVIGKLFEDEDHTYKFKKFVAYGIYPNAIDVMIEEMIGYLFIDCFDLNNENYCPDSFEDKFDIVGFGPYYYMYCGSYDNSTHLTAFKQFITSCGIELESGRWDWAG